MAQDESWRYRRAEELAAAQPKLWPAPPRQRPTPVAPTERPRRPQAPEQAAARPLPRTLPETVTALRSPVVRDAAAAGAFVAPVVTPVSGNGSLRANAALLGWLGGAAVLLLGAGAVWTLEGQGQSAPVVVAASSPAQPATAAARPAARRDERIAADVAAPQAPPTARVAPRRPAAVATVAKAMVRATPHRHPAHASTRVAERDVRAAPALARAVTHSRPALVGKPGTGAQHRIDCGVAQVTFSRLVCGDANLLRLDRRMAADYAVAVRGVDRTTERRRDTDQTTFLNRRGACTDAACVADTYRTRIAALERPGK